MVSRLEDAKPGSQIALHALVPWEREAIVKICEEWLEIVRCAPPGPCGIRGSWHHRRWEVQAQVVVTLAATPVWGS
ncbi:unnamed protein product [[Actinomadura] parvosata subsp. kistnae]|nr:unnamed protein product [Actinomadura parvosata subsp. kistnae]